MTRLLSILLSTLLTGFAVGSMTACHPPTTIVTPQGQIAYSADQLVTRIDELQNAAIQANTSGNLSTASTRILVQFAGSADAVLAATPSGWPTTVRTLWTTAKGNLGTQTNPLIVALMSAVDAVIGGL